MIGWLLITILLCFISYSCGVDVGWYRGHSDAVWKLMRLKGQDNEENNDDPADNDSDDDCDPCSGRDNQDPRKGPECSE